MIAASGFLFVEDILGNIAAYDLVGSRLSILPSIISTLLLPNATGADTLSSVAFLNNNYYLHLTSKLYSTTYDRTSNTFSIN